MSKKKATTTSKAARSPRSVKTAKPTQARRMRKATTAHFMPPPASKIHVYRHEIASNTANAPLIVDIPIAAGRGKQPSRPSFVGFTAEMSEDHWPDQFAFRIVSLDNASVRVMISRIDNGSNDMTWGATLVVHVLVVADAV